MVHEFHWAGDDTDLHGYADSDWAGDRRNMKSTSGGGVIMWSGHCIKAWSTSQSALALSSGEAELYAMTKVAVQLSGVISMAKDCGVSLTGVVKSDQQFNRNSSPRWFGRSVQTYQGAVLVDPVKDQGWGSQVTKVFGTNNVADAMTWAVDRWALDKYMAAMNITLMPGRADKASRAQ